MVILFSMVTVRLFSRPTTVTVPCILVPLPFLDNFSHSQHVPLFSTFFLSSNVLLFQHVNHSSSFSLSSNVLLFQHIPHSSTFPYPQSSSSSFHLFLILQPFLILNRHAPHSPHSFFLILLLFQSS